MATQINALHNYLRQHLCVFFVPNFGNMSPMYVPDFFASTYFDGTILSGFHASQSDNDDLWPCPNSTYLCSTPAHA
jgi:hypothetical protein